jgi:predicted amino acid-binding ACT domain protein
MTGVATIIHHDVASKTEMITGISSMANIALISIEGSGMMGVPGFAKRVFACLNDASINVILISQGSSEHSICVAVRNDVKNQAIQMLDHAFEKEISNGNIQPISCSEDVSIISLVGENMRNHPGISGRMFGSLGKNGINVLAIAQGSNERNISAVIHSTDRKKAINVLHESFFEDAKNNNLVPMNKKSKIEEIITSKDKTGVYVITFNSPNQFRTLLESIQNYDNSFLEKTKKFVLNNSTNRDTDEEYKEIAEKYDFTIIWPKENLGITGGRQFISEHFEDSDLDYYFFFEDDLLIYPDPTIISCLSMY